MKKIKFILTAVMFALVIFMPLSLVGCSKHYKITVSIVEGGGNTGNSVVTVDSLHVSKDLIGKNEVEKGSTFEYSVVPQTHYQIKWIKQDGKIIYEAGSANNTLVPEENGTVRPCIIDVQSDHNIEIAFETKTYALTFFYNVGTVDAPEYEQLQVYKDGFPVVYELTTKYDNPLTIDGIKDFGFTMKQDNGSYIALEFDSDTFTVTGNHSYYTISSKSSLVQLLGLDLTIVV